MMTEITRASTAMQSADISRERMGLFEKAVTDARLLANECDASTEFAQKRNRKRKTFRDEVNAGKTRAPRCPTSFQTYGVCM